MKKIKSFRDWNLVNEAKFYYLSQFSKALDGAPKEFEEIVTHLMSLWGKETGIDMTMFDIEGDMLSYTSDRNINSVLFLNLFGEPFGIPFLLCHI